MRWMMDHLFLEHAWSCVRGFRGGWQFKSGDCWNADRKGLDTRCPGFYRGDGRGVRMGYDPENVTLSSRQVDGVCVVDAVGRITLGEGAGLRSALVDLVRKGNHKILLNLSQVAYIDSVGIGELVAAFSAVSRLGAKMKLLHPTKRVHYLLRMTNVDTCCDVVEDEATAISTF
jgi:anti-sigma B factor antagonist